MAGGEYALALQLLGERQGEELQPSDVGAWTGPFPLPEAVAELHSIVGPQGLYLRGTGNNFFIPVLADLWQYQAGYRWNAVDGEPIVGWDDDWLIIADHGADPFIFSRKNEDVMFDHHGEGEWNPEPLFKSVAQMFVTLSAISELCWETWDRYEEYEPDSESAELKRTVDMLSPFYESTDALVDTLEQLGIDV